MKGQRPYGRPWLIVLACFVWFLAATRVVASRPLPPQVGAVYSRIVFVAGQTAVWVFSGGEAGSSWVVGVDVVDGSERWSAPFVGLPSPAVSSGTNSFAMIHEQRLEVRATSSGEVIWSTNLATIPQQIAFKQEWFNGVLSPSELASINCPYHSRYHSFDLPRNHGLVSIGGTNLVVFRSGTMESDFSALWEDWFLFDGRSSKLVASGEGALIGATANSVLFRRCESNYRIHGTKVSRGPYHWGPQDRLTYTERLLRVRPGPPSAVWFLLDDGSRVSTLYLRESVWEDDRWWKSSTNLIRVSTHGPPRAEGWSLSGKVLWRTNLPKMDGEEKDWLEWLGEEESIHYITGRNTVLRIVPAKLSAEQIVPPLGETTSTNWQRSSFALAPHHHVLLEAVGEQEWRGSRLDQGRALGMPANQVVRLLGRDSRTGKVLWSKSETVAIKRLTD